MNPLLKKPTIKQRIKKLKEEKTELQQEEQHLHGEVMHETYKRRKQPIIEERKKISSKIAEKQQQIKKLKNIIATEKLDKLIRQERMYLSLSIFNHQTPIPDNLKLKLKFRGCKHKITMHVKHLFQRYERVGGKIIKVPDAGLLPTWQSFIKHRGARDGRIMCRKCGKGYIDWELHRMK